MIFTKEELEILSIGEKNFDAAVYHENIRNAKRSDTEMIVNIYENRLGKKLTHNYSCSICVLNIYKTVGKVYFADKKELEEQERKSTIEVDEEITKTDSVEDEKQQKFHLFGSRKSRSKGKDS